jgi:hypothetical protein
VRPGGLPGDRQDCQAGARRRVRPGGSSPEEEDWHEEDTFHDVEELESDLFHMEVDNRPGEARWAQIRFLPID